MGIDLEAIEREAREKHEAEVKMRGELRKRRQQMLYSTKVGGCMPSVTLSSGHSMPLVGLGTWKSDASTAEERKRAANQVKVSVECAIKFGYRHIDCAENYQNEGDVGDALATVYSHGVVSRSDLFLTSKLWNTDHAAGRVRAACEKSIRLLKTEYLDLYLMHWPVTMNRGEEVKPSIRETWEAMEALVDDGLVRSIGVSNFSIKKVKGILEYARIRPSVVQVEVHPYCRNDDLIAWCAEEGIHVTAHSPLGSPDSASLLGRDKAMPTVMDEPIVTEMADKLGVDVGQLLIRWGMQHGTSVLPKSSNPSRIRSNIEGPLLGLTALSEGDFQTLSNLPIQIRSLCGSVWLNEKGPYRTLEDFWDEPAIVPSDAQLRDARSRRHRAEYRSATQEFVTLSNGCEMPMLGFGTWKGNKGEIYASVMSAVKAGYRHVDCAEYYKNEGEVGDAIEEILGHGVVSRSELFLVSKLWNTDHGAKRVRAACEKSIRLLKVDYLDLYLIHWPVTGNRGAEVSPSIRETWEAMEALVDDGLVRAIGVSNFSSKKVEELLSYARVAPAVVQVECHPYCRNSKLIRWCAKKNIHVTAHSSLGSPDSASMLRRTGPALMDDPLLQELAEKYGKDIGQILIRYGLDHGTSVLAKSLKPRRIAGNIAVFDWDLSEEDYKKLNGLSTQKRMVDGSAFLSGQGPYRTLEDLWDTPDGQPEN